METFFFYLASPVFTIILSLIMGFLFCRYLLPINNYGFHSLDLFWGSLILNLITSIIATKGVTVQVLFIPLYLFLFLQDKKKEADIEKFNFKLEKFKPLFKIISITLIWATLFFIFYAHYKVGTLLYQDNYFYTTLSERIYKTGNENFITNHLLNQYYKGVTPYHYTEIYQNILMSKLLNINSTWVFMISVPIFMCTITSYFIYELIKKYNQSLPEILIIIFCVLLLFVGSINFIPIDYQEKNSYTLNMLNHPTPKYMLGFLAFLISYKFYMNSEVEKAAIYLLLVSVFNYLMFPVVILTVMLLAVYSFIIKKISWKRMLFLISMSIFHAALIFIFYKVFGISQSINSINLSVSDVISSFSDNFLTIIKRIIGTNFYITIDYLIIVLPVLVLSYVYRFKNHSFDFWSVCALTVILSEVGISLCWLFNYLHGQAWQFQFFTVSLASNALICFVFIYFLNSNLSKLKYLVIIPILLISANKLYFSCTKYYSFNDKRNLPFSISSDSYSEYFKITNKIEPYSNIAFVGKSNHPGVYPIGTILQNINSTIVLESVDSSVLKKENKENEFADFNFYANQHKNYTYDKLFTEYIKLKKIEYLVGYKTEDELEEIHKKNSTEIFRDKKSNFFIRKLNL